MALDMKKCKECGKLFVPKTKQSVYCDDLHFRPCPVCGKAVEAKYLSDPPRCCSKECSALARSKKKEEEKAKTRETALNPMKVFDPSNNSPNQSGSTVRTLFDLPNEDDSATAPAVARTTVKKLPQKAPDTEHAAGLRKSYPVRTYAGDPVLGFEPGHEYALDVDKDDRNILYVITAFYDFTEGKTVDLVMNLSSQISVNQYFARL